MKLLSCTGWSVFFWENKCATSIRFCWGNYFFFPINSTGVWLISGITVKEERLGDCSTFRREWTTQSGGNFHSLKQKMCFFGKKKSFSPSNASWPFLVLGKILLLQMYEYSRIIIIFSFIFKLPYSIHWDCNKKLSPCSPLGKKRQEWCSQTQLCKYKRDRKILKIFLIELLLQLRIGNHFSTQGIFQNPPVGR